jgi:anti-sigma regulatory factor (Ser/Thr protein kinase)
MGPLNQVFEGRAMTIGAEPERLAEARDWALRAAADAGLPDPDCYQIKLAMSEAVANAIEHGSTGPHDSIRIDAFTLDGALIFEIRDSGTFVQPSRRATEEDESGRGLELVALVMDEVQLHSTADGSLMRFAKRL